MAEKNKKGAIKENNVLKSHFPTILNSIENMPDTQKFYAIINLIYNIRDSELINDFYSNIKAFFVFLLEGIHRLSKTTDREIIHHRLLQNLLWFPEKSRLIEENLSLLISTFPPNGEFTTYSNLIQIIKRRGLLNEYFLSLLELEERAPEFSHRFLISLLESVQDNREILDEYYNQIEFHFHAVLDKKALNKQDFEQDFDFILEAVDKFFSVYQHNLSERKFSVFWKLFEVIKKLDLINEKLPDLFHTNNFYHPSITKALIENTKQYLTPSLFDKLNWNVVLKGFYDIFRLFKSKYPIDIISNDLEYGGPVRDTLEYLSPFKIYLESINKKIEFTKIISSVFGEKNIPLEKRAQTLIRREIYWLDDEPRLFNFSYVDHRKVPLPLITRTALKCQSEKVFKYFKGVGNYDIIIGAHDINKAIETCQKVYEIVHEENIKIMRPWDTREPRVRLFEWNEETIRINLKDIIKIVVRLKSDKIYRYYYNLRDFYVIIGARDLEEATSCLSKYHEYEIHRDVELWE